MNEPMKPRRGRPTSPIKRDDWHVKVEEDVSLFFRMLFHDTFTGATKKNALSDLVNRLLKEERARLQNNKAKE